MAADQRRLAIDSIMNRIDGMPIQTERHVGNGAKQAPRFLFTGNGSVRLITDGTDAAADFRSFSLNVDPTVKLLELAATGNNRQPSVKPRFEGG
jgi:hypothetical protein